MFPAISLLRRRAFPTVPPGERVYAIGDIHGKKDLFEKLLKLLAADEAGRGPAATRIVVLGDFIDRGSASASVLTTLHWWQTNSERVTVLKGNHEAMLLDSINENAGAQRLWLRCGGRETLRSYGIELPSSGSLPASDLASIIRAAIPHHLVEWLRALPLSHKIGDYFFCHAGIEPGVPLKEQDPEYLLWARGEFLKSRQDHGCVVVHGHSICGPTVEFAGNRICVDTGGYSTGILSAVGLEDQRQWCISTSTA